MNQEQHQELEVMLRQIRKASEKIIDNNFTRKTTGGMYPLEVGYRKGIRRPFQDLLRWMIGVEELLESIIAGEVG